MMRSSILVHVILLIILCYYSNAGRLSEDERVAYFKAHHQWPPNWQEETEAHTIVQRAREEEIMQLTGADERWENWMQFVHGLMGRKFTPRGFDVVEAPRHIFEKLRDHVDHALRKFEELPNESEDGGGIFGEIPCKFVEVPFRNEIMDELRQFHESWVGGIELVPTAAYGVRFYTNGSSLVMHHDRIETHVISSIFHIAHSYDDDNRPWPIQIEDHDGVVHSVNLEPGQILFYESARCLHGRMSALHGKYYGSLFLHYKPADESLWSFTNEDVINAVPPHWKDGIVEDTGSRWAGQGITVDSRAAFGSAPRVVNGVFVHDKKSEYAFL